MKNIIILFSFLFACAPNIFFVSLLPEEERQVKVAWDLAKELVDYDYYSWIATDSLFKYIKPDSTKIKGWIVFKDTLQTVVVFGKLSDSGLIANFRLPFKLKYPGPISLKDTIYSISSEPYIEFKAMQLMRNIFQNEFDSLRVPMNSYVLFHGDTILT
jgi:hypothetical protein